MHVFVPTAAAVVLNNLMYMIGGAAGSNVNAVGPTKSGKSETID